MSTMKVGFRIKVYRFFAINSVKILSDKKRNLCGFRFSNRTEISNRKVFQLRYVLDKLPNFVVKKQLVEEEN